MSSNNQSKQDEILQRQRELAMIHAANMVENRATRSKPPPPSHAARPVVGRTLSSLTTGVVVPSKKGSSYETKNPNRLDESSSKTTTTLRPTLKRPRTKQSGEQQGGLKRPSGAMKRPSLRNNNNTTTTAAASIPSNNKGSLSSILLSNSSTAKYLSKDASASSPPRLLKHYDKVNPRDYWKNLREWDFVRELNQSRRVGSTTAAAAAAGVKSSKETKDDDADSSSTVKSGTVNTNNNNNNNQPKKQLVQKPLPNTFSSHREYCALWSPLLMIETRAQLLSDAISDIPHWKSKSEKRPIRVRLELRKRDLETKVEYSDNDDAVGVVVRGVVVPSSFSSSEQDYCSQERMFMANDVVCLVREEQTIWDAAKGSLLLQSSSSQNGVVSPSCIIGHLEHTRRSIENLVITISRKRWKEIGQGEMTLLKLGCNITSLREFTALCRMDRLPLAEYILCNKMNVKGDEMKDSSSAVTGVSSDLDNIEVMDEDREKELKKHVLEKMGGPIALGKGFVDYARRKFNLSQLKGISASAAEYGNGGFTLIKGPPGTGKTTTLCALLNALHIRQMNQYFGEVKILAESYDAVVGKRAALSLSDATKKRPRILVCAPSNAAVDNIILKIMEDGFIDGNGLRYNPSIVRIGSGQSASVKDVCLEDKVEQYLSDSMDVAKLEHTIEGFKGECRRIHSDITKLRQRMNAMKQAAPYPLSKEWEIRIDEESEIPRVYFVNHKDKTTTYEVPPPPEPGEKYFPARAMPEYKTFVTKVVKMVERYNNINTKIERYSLCRRAAAMAASSGDRGHSHAMNDIRIQLETHILDSVHIVMTTLGTAGNRALEAAKKFEVVVIDEAAQSVEPSTLAGLQLGSSHAILVGDPQQLPATIFSMSGRNTKYDRSLFARLEEAGHAVHMLDTQFRMHPAISDFPRRIFYDGKLMDGVNVKHPEYGNPLKKAVFKKFNAFQPFTVLDLESSEERGGTSLSNSAEAQLALHLFNNLKSGTNGLSTKSRVAVITPYAQQAALLRRTFENSLGGNYQQFVEINTVDAFQGREANIVIFSCVRAAGSKGIGFLSDVRRMNVALTRAKNFLFVIARCSSIVVNPYWRDLVCHAYETDAVIKVPFSGSRQSRFTFPHLSSLQAAPAPGQKPPSKNVKPGGTGASKREGSTVQLMGLELDIPPTSST